MHVNNCSSLEELREEIDKIDKEIVYALAKRVEYVKQASRFKKNEKLVVDQYRIEQVIKNVSQYAKEVGSDHILVEKTYKIIISESIKIEERVFNEKKKEHIK